MPLAIDLYCGLGGWTEGLLAEGYDVVGFDIERHIYGEHYYPAQLVLQDVLTLHGRQFKDAALIVASPPCQEYSYMAMPWSRAKAIAAEYRSGVRDVKKLTALFDACFRIQCEACEAAGRHIPLVVENVRGAQPWVGRSRWNFGSFHLWGDVPALMPITQKHVKVPTMGAGWYPLGHPKHVPGLAFNGHAERNLREGVKCGDRNIGRADGGHKWNTGFDVGLKLPGNNSPDRWSDREVARLKDYPVDGQKVPGFRFDGSGKSFQSESVHRHISKAWRDKHYEQTEKAEHIKQGGDWFNADQPSISRMCGSKSTARKAASAMIARIPLVLARHIARSWWPMEATA